jgi:lipoyl(octanoyl) transferase
LVGYPILQLGAIRKDVVWYVRMLEEVMIRASAEFGICAVREAGKTGIWVASEEKDFTRSSQRTQSSQREPVTAEKLGAIGVHISRWVTSHGFAYNVATDLRNFDLIVPCGIVGRKATSLEKLLGRDVKVSEVTPKVARHFGDVFGLEMTAGSRDELFGKLELVEQQVAVPA